MPTVTVSLCVTVFLTILGSWQFGYHTGVLNAPQNVLVEYIKKVSKQRNKDAEINETFIKSLIVSLFAFSGIFGGLLGGKIANKFGRRNSILLNSLLIFIGISLMTFSKLMSSYESLIIGRLIIGFCCGLYTNLVPMFLSEIATTPHRGAISEYTISIVLINIYIHTKLTNGYILTNRCLIT